MVTTTVITTATATPTAAPVACIVDPGATARIVTPVAVTPVTLLRRFLWALSRAVTLLARMTAMGTATPGVATTVGLHPAVGAAVPVGRAMTAQTIFTVVAMAITDPGDIGSN